MRFMSFTFNSELVTLFSIYCLYYSNESIASEWPFEVLYCFAIATTLSFVATFEQLAIRRGVLLTFLSAPDCEHEHRARCCFVTPVFAGAFAKRYIFSKHTQLFGCNFDDCAHQHATRATKTTHLFLRTATYYNHATSSACLDNDTREWVVARTLTCHCCCCPKQTTIQLAARIEFS
jgi:hypothetical protein